MFLQQKSSHVAALAVGLSLLAGCTTAQMEELQATMSESFENSLNASAFGSGSVEVVPDRAPASDTQTIRYDAAFLSGVSSEAESCTRALARACSDSYAGVAAPFCVSSKAELCGVFPATPGGDVSSCFESVGEGRLRDGACRASGLAPGVTISQTSATFPFGSSRPVREQYQVMVEQYQSQAYRDLYFRADGSTRCAKITQMGRNLRCQIEVIDQNMVDAAANTCAFKHNPNLDFNQAGDALNEVKIKMIDQCSVKPQVLDAMLDSQTKRAYAFR